MKCEKINERSFVKDSVSSYKGKNGVIRGWSRLRFLAIRVRKIEAIQAKFEAPEVKFSGKLCFPLFFPNKEIF